MHHRGNSVAGDVLQDCRYTSRASNYKTSEVAVDASDHKVDDSLRGKLKEADWLADLWALAAAT